MYDGYRNEDGYWADKYSGLGKFVIDEGGSKVIGRYLRRENDDIFEVIYLQSINPRHGNHIGRDETVYRNNWFVKILGRFSTYRKREKELDALIEEVG